MRPQESRSSDATDVATRGEASAEVRRRFVHTSLRLAAPEEVDPEEEPYFSLWTKTPADPDPVESPVLSAFDRLVAAQEGVEDALWTAVHWATGKVPVTAVLPAPRVETHRFFVWEDGRQLEPPARVGDPGTSEDLLFALSASPEKGVRVHFPEEPGVDDRVRTIEWLIRVCERLRETGLAGDFPDALGDYQGRAWWKATIQTLLETDEDVGAVAVFFTADVLAGGPTG